MPHNAAFHQGLHCLLRLKLPSENVIQFELEIVACDPSIYTIELATSGRNHQDTKGEQPREMYRVTFTDDVCVNQTLNE